MPHIRRLLIIALLLATAIPALAQGDGGSPTPTPIEFAPFINEAFGLAGIVPDGWEEVQPGFFMGSQFGPNLVIQVAEGETVLSAMAIVLTGVGLAEGEDFDAVELPEGEAYTTESFTWALFRFDVPDDTLPLVMDVAITEDASDAGPLLVILQAVPEAYARMHAEVFLPVVDGLVPASFPEMPITLEPFTDALFAISGVRPAGWAEVGAGEVRRQRTPGDFTSLIQQRAPSVPADDLAPLLAERLGAAEAPEPVETLEAETITWTRYTLNLDLDGVAATLHLATAEGEDGALLVLLLARPDEADALYADVFLPVVDAFREEDLGPVALTPFTGEALGVRGVVPVLWEEMQPGYFVDPLGGANLTIERLADLAPADVMPIFAARLGLDDVPGAGDAYETDAFTWTRYTVPLEVGEVTITLDIALAPLEGDTLVVMLQSAQEAREDNIAGVLLPVLDALVPLDAATDSADSDG